MQIREEDMLIKIGDLVRVKESWTWVYERFEGKIGLVVEVITSINDISMVKVDFGNHHFYFNYNTVEIICE